MSAGELLKQLIELVPGLDTDMLYSHEMYELIVIELRRLKEVEAKYEGLCK